MSHEAHPDADRRSPFFWPLAGAGLIMMGMAVRGLLHHHVATNPFATVRLVVGLDLVHDAVIAPVVLTIGLALVRLRPRWLRAPLAAGLFISAMVTLYTYPSLRGFGRIADNPSRLPNNYAHGLIGVLVVVWVGVAVAAGVAAAHARRQ